MPELLSARRVSSMKAPDFGRVEVVDTGARGLCFRRTANGERTWSLRIKVAGRDRRFMLGEYPALSLADARTAAGKVRAEVLAGADPTAEKRAARIKQQAAPTVRSVLDQYVDLHLCKLADGKRREAQLRTALQAFWGIPLAKLTRSDLQAIIDAKAKDAPVAANRLKAALVHLANWSRKRGYLTEPIAAEIDRPTKEQPRDRVLSLDEIGAIWLASQTEDQPWGSFMRLLILTAQRRGDVSNMTWSEVGKDRWEIPSVRTNNRRPHIVHLSTPAIEEIVALHHGGGSSKALIFTTTGRSSVSGFGRLKKRLDLASGVPDWRLHDFRTAFATHCAEAGIAEGVVDRVLNHSASASSASAVARVYQRSHLLPQRAEALDLWAEMVVRAGH